MKDLINDRSAWVGFLDTVSDAAAAAHVEMPTTAATGRILIRRHPVTYVDFTPKLGLVFIEGGFDGGPVQERFLAVMRAVALAGQAVACITTVEAWVTNSPSARPSEVADRYESIVLDAEHITFGRTARIAPILTEADRRQCLPWRNTRGRFIDVLGPQPPSADIVAHARAFLTSLTQRGSLSVATVDLDNFN